MKPRPERTGFALIAVLALLALAGSLFAVWTRHTLAQHQRTRLSHQHAQAEWLARAALSRAAARLRSAPDYQGETWRLTPEQLGQSYAAEVITVVSWQDEAAQVTATVDLPPGEARRVRHTQSINVPETPDGESP